MSITDGHQAIIARIVSQAGGTSVVLPEGPGKSLPRYVVQEAGGSQRTVTLAGDTLARPEVVVRVETEAGRYATENNALTKALVGMFPPGASFGGVHVRDAPSVRPPLPTTDGVYSVPVVIRAEFGF